jgi:hypothetical protein
MFTKHVVKKMVVYVFLLVMGMQQLAAHDLHKKLQLPSDATVKETREAYKKALDAIANMNIPETQLRRLKGILGALYVDYLEGLVVNRPENGDNQGAQPGEVS